MKVKYSQEYIFLIYLFFFDIYIRVQKPANSKYSKFYDPLFFFTSNNIRI